MFQDERCLAILDHLKHHKRITAEDICELFGVSRDTARRDLVKLEEEGRIVRTRGGAMLPTLLRDVPGYSNRLAAATEEKRRIGAAAASIVMDGDYILMDASTTVQCVAEQLRAKDVSVVTNSIDIAGLLCDREVRVTMLGGSLNARHRFVYGQQAIEQLADYRVNKLFIGACGITADGIMNPYEEEGHLIREMMERAEQVILLADHTKFGRSMFYRVADVGAVDKIVTDRLPDAALRQAIEAQGVELIVTDAEETEEDGI